MKKIFKFLTIAMSVMLVISSCNAASAPESEALPELSKEDLASVKERIQLHQETTNFIFVTVTKEDYDSWATSAVHDEYVKTFYKTIMSDVEGENYHSATVVEQLQEGMLINEVYDLIGRPHFNAKHYPFPSISFGDREYDFCAMYVLNDGRILLTRYVPLFHENYDAEYRRELIERIPDFEQYEKTEKDGNYFTRWPKLDSVSIVTEEQLLAMRFDNETLQTAPEHLPKNASFGDLQKITVGMTYNQVKELAGTHGFDKIVLDGVHHYYWICLKDPAKPEYISRFNVCFVMSETGELIVSKIGA